MSETVINFTPYLPCVFLTRQKSISIAYIYHWYQQFLTLVILQSGRHAWRCLCQFFALFWLFRGTHESQRSMVGHLFITRGARVSGTRSCCFNCYHFPCCSSRPTSMTWNIRVNERQRARARGDTRTARHLHGLSRRHLRNKVMLIATRSLYALSFAAIAYTCAAYIYILAWYQSALVRIR